jgi:hypothetical protein
MSKVIIYSNESGGMAVCVPTGELPIEQVQAKDIPAGVQSFIVDRSTLPQAEDDFYDAWQQTNGTVTINLDKAKEITKKRLRFARTSLLAAQDILFQRALETGSDTTAIVAEKQRLRNITNLVDDCTTTAQLRNLQP